jgi:hypothetical protein
MGSLEMLHFYLFFHFFQYIIPIQVFNLHNIHLPSVFFYDFTNQFFFFHK